MRHSPTAQLDPPDDIGSWSTKRIAWHYAVAKKKSPQEDMWLSLLRDRLARNDDSPSPSVDMDHAAAQTAADEVLILGGPVDESDAANLARCYLGAVARLRGSDQ